jgi:hypothetical protein
VENESPWCENGKGIQLDDKNEKICFFSRLFKDTYSNAVRLCKPALRDQ